MEKTIILASASPRRRELLRLVVPKYIVSHSKFDESNVPDDLSPTEHVKLSASMKARDVASRYPDALVIGADTIVVIDNDILGKPKSRERVYQMLARLSNRTHQVYTGLAVICDNKELVDFECTDVTFRELDDNIISRYVDSREPMDKAGAYAVQGIGAVLVKSICGCYFNVVGLPIYKLSKMIEEFGVIPINFTTIH